MKRLTISWQGRDYPVTGVDYVGRVEAAGGSIHVIRCFHDAEAFELRLTEGEWRRWTRP